MKIFNDNYVRLVYVDEKDQQDKTIITKYVAHNMKYQGHYLLNETENLPDLWVVTDVYRNVFDGDKIIDSQKIEMYYCPKKTIDEKYELSSVKLFIDNVEGYRTDWYDRENKRFSYKTIENGAVNNYRYKKYEWVYHNPRFLHYNEEYLGRLSDEFVMDEVLNNVFYINNELMQKNQEKGFQKTLGKMEYKNA